MKTKLVVTGLLYIFTGCSERVLIPATYVQKHDQPSYVSEEYKFQRENRFEYKFFSDDLGSSKYGVGNYQVKEHRLILEFTDELLDRPRPVLIRKEASVADSSKKSYRVQVKTYSGDNLLGANVILTNKINEVIAGSTTDNNGAAEITLSQESTPAFLNVSFIGYEDMLLEVNPKQNLNFVVVLADKVYGARITNKRVEKKIKIKKASIMIDAKEYQNATVTENK